MGNRNDLPSGVGAAIRQILDHFWDDELKDYDAADAPNGHVFEALVEVDEWLAGRAGQRVDAVTCRCCRHAFNPDELRSVRVPGGRACWPCVWDYLSVVDPARLERDLDSTELVDELETFDPGVVPTAHEDRTRDCDFADRCTEHEF